MTGASREDSRPRLYPRTLALVSSWYGWWPTRLLHFVICLPSVSSGKVWLNPGSWEVKEILVAANSSLRGSGILGQESHK